MNRTFKASLPVRSAFVLVLISAPLFSWWLRKDEAATLLFAFFATGVVAVIFAWPRTIHFDDDGIWQRNFWGRKRFIAWNEVDSLAHLDADDQTIVGGGDVQIVHGSLHCDKQEFCKIIEQRTGTHLAAGMWA